MWLVKTDNSGYSPIDTQLNNLCEEDEVSNQFDLQLMLDQISEILLILPVILIVSYLLYRRRKIRMLRDKEAALYPTTDHK